MALSGLDIALHDLIARAEACPSPPCWRAPARPGLRLCQRAVSRHRGGALWPFPGGDRRTARPRLPGDQTRIGPRLPRRPRHRRSAGPGRPGYRPDGRYQRRLSAGDGDRLLSASRVPASLSSRNRSMSRICPAWQRSPGRIRAHRTARALPGFPLRDPAAPGSGGTVAARPGVCAASPAMPRSPPWPRRWRRDDAPHLGSGISFTPRCNGFGAAAFRSLERPMPSSNAMSAKMPCSACAAPFPLSGQQRAGTGRPARRHCRSTPSARSSPIAGSPLIPWRIAGAAGDPPGSLALRCLPSGRPPGHTTAATGRRGSPARRAHEPGRVGPV